MTEVLNYRNGNGYYTMTESYFRSMTKVDQAKMAKLAYVPIEWMTIVDKRQKAIEKILKNKDCNVKEYGYIEDHTVVTDGTVAYMFDRRYEFDDCYTKRENMDGIMRCIDEAKKEDYITMPLPTDNEMDIAEIKCKCRKNDGMPYIKLENGTYMQIKLLRQLKKIMPNAVIYGGDYKRTIFAKDGNDIAILCGMHIQEAEQ